VIRIVAIGCDGCDGRKLIGSLWESVDGLDDFDHVDGVDVAWIIGKQCELNLFIFMH
jgi:hypothetical protein